MLYRLVESHGSEPPRLTPGSSLLLRHNLHSGSARELELEVLDMNRSRIPRQYPSHLAGYLHEVAVRPVGLIPLHIEPGQPHLQFLLRVTPHALAERYAKMGGQP
jgi:hypothetical protein